RRGCAGNASAGQGEGVPPPVRPFTGCVAPSWQAPVLVGPQERETSGISAVRILLAVHCECSTFGAARVVATKGGKRPFAAVGFGILPGSSWLVRGARN
ncbi:MAG: hypothetical protein KDK08_18460, partial [Rhizobiaceae bacterium]|nr:hypothetical protein [Rhizobiaceae bacterium]